MIYAGVVTHYSMVASATCVCGFRTDDHFRTLKKVRKVMTDYPIRNSRAVLKICYAAVCAMSFLVIAHAHAQPSTVFVWNRPPPGMPNEADFVGEGFIWQELGLLDANGKPGHIIVNGTNIFIMDDAGNILGEVIRNADGQFIGYRNRDGTKEAYDINSGYTMSNAWKRVAPNGELHILKHGLFIDDNGNGVTDPGEGGVVVCDSTMEQVIQVLGTQQLRVLGLEPLMGSPMGLKCPPILLNQDLAPISGLG